MTTKVEVSYDPELLAAIDAFQRKVWAQIAATYPSASAYSLNVITNSLVCVLASLAVQGDISIDVLVSTLTQRIELFRQLPPDAISINGVMRPIDKGDPS